MAEPDSNLPKTPWWLLKPLPEEGGESSQTETNTRERAQRAQGLTPSLTPAAPSARALGVALDPESDWAKMPSDAEAKKDTTLFEDFDITPANVGKAVGKEALLQAASASKNAGAAPAVNLAFTGYDVYSAAKAREEAGLSPWGTDLPPGYKDDRVMEMFQEKESPHGGLFGALMGRNPISMMIGGQTNIAAENRARSLKGLDELTGFGALGAAFGNHPYADALNKAMLSGYIPGTRAAPPPVALARALMNQGGEDDDFSPKAQGGFGGQSSAGPDGWGWYDFD